ncbi:MAG: hypothetical protein CML17_06030 [Pusillimonas sp.]|nr:hypothetical protein [Pusillimonas sp.]
MLHLLINGLSLGCTTRYLAKLPALMALKFQGEALLTMWVVNETGEKWAWHKRLPDCHIALGPATDR